MYLYIYHVHIYLFIQFMCICTYIMSISIEIIHVFVYISCPCLFIYFCLYIYPQVKHSVTLASDDDKDFLFFFHICLVHASLGRTLGHAGWPRTMRRTSFFFFHICLNIYPQVEHSVTLATDDEEDLAAWLIAMGKHSIPIKVASGMLQPLLSFCALSFCVQQLCAHSEQLCNWYCSNKHTLEPHEDKKDKLPEV